MYTSARTIVRIDRNAKIVKFAKLLAAIFGVLVAFVAFSALFTTASILPALAVFMPFGASFGWVIGGGFVVAVLALLKFVTTL